MPQRILLLPAALLFSGFAALAVEVLWLRLLCRLLGGSAQAVAAILVAYMGGLALGSAIAARRADRWDRTTCLRTYVRLELLIWIVASVLTVLLAKLPVGLGGWLASIPEGTPRFAVRFGTALLALLIPTTAMGATLPLAVRAWAGDSRSSFLRGTAFLYAANTLGAAAGALAAPFVLVPLGVRAGALAAAFGSLIAAGLASLYTPATTKVEPSDEPEDPSTGARILPIAALACCAGGAALGLEILWTRWLTPLAGSSTHSFGMVLALVLVGIVAGSGLVSLFGGRIARPADLAGLLAIFGALLAAALMGVIDNIALEFGRLTDVGELDTRSSMATLLTYAAFAVLPPMLCFGAVLPLAARAARARGDDRARAVGIIYSANTLGALAASALTGLVLIPAFGLSRTVAGLLVPSALAGALVLWMRSGDRRQRLLAVALGVGTTFATCVARPPSAILSAAAIYKPRHQSKRLGRVIYYREGPEGPVLVEAARANRTFYVSGRTEASDSWLDVRTQYLIGHLPAILAGGSDRSLVIGLGSGMTAGALTRHGKVTIAELNPAVPPATRLFDHRNHRVLDSAHLTLEDGRVVLLEPGPPFDLVTTDPIHPGVAGSTALYTVDHLRLCKTRLRPGGVVSLWVPLYQMGAEELRAIVGSFLEVFPDADLWLSHYQAILVGGGRPRDGTGALELLRAGWSPNVAADMSAALIGSPEEIAVSRVAGPEELKRYASGTRLISDDDPWIELTLPKFLYHSPLDRNVLALLALRKEPGPVARLWPAFEAVQRSHLLSSAHRYDLAVALLESTLAEGRSPFLEHSVVLRVASGNWAAQLMKNGRRQEAVDRARGEALHPEATIESLVLSWEVLLQTGDAEALAKIERRLRKEWPSRPEAYVYAAHRLIGEDRFQEAFDLATHALRMNDYPGYAAFAVGLAGRARLGTGDVAGGLAMVRQSLSMDPEQSDLQELMATARASAR